MAKRWTHVCVRSVAGAIEKDTSGSFSAAGPSFSPQSALSSSVEQRLGLLFKPGWEFGSGKCRNFDRRAQLLVHERVEGGVNSRFSPQFWWVGQFDLKCGRILQEFGCYSRRFSSISWAEELEGKQVEETVEEDPRILSFKRPLGSRHRTGSNVNRRLKERCFDDIIEKEKKLKIILKIKDLLGAEPSRSMTLLDLGKSKDDIGFKGDGRLIVFLKRYPSVFRVHETAAFGKLAWFQFTPEAEAAFDEELEIRKGMSNEVVTKLRKLLMMSSDRTLPLSKIAHLGRDLGLPDDFRKNLVHEYPMYFRVVGSTSPLDFEGPKLELVGWSSRLAVTEVEKEAQEQKQELGLDSPSMSDINIPKRNRPSKFDLAECPSPYQDAKNLHHRSVQFEKRAVFVIEELLSLTLEKRVLVDHLTHFRKEFNFSKKLHGMLIRHPDYFYVSRKGSRDTVFLRGAFEEIHVPGNRKEYSLIDKHPLVVVKEKFAALMEVSPVHFTTKRDQAPFQERDVPEHDRTAPAQARAITKIPW